MMKMSLFQRGERLDMLLGMLHTFIAINAFGGGAYGMMGPKELPVEWLEGSPFSSFFIPSLVLFVVVGGSHAMAAFWVLKRNPSAYKAALIAGSVLLIWIMAQLAIIGFVSFLQPVMAGLAILVIWMARKLKQVQEKPAQ